MKHWCVSFTGASSSTTPTMSFWSAVQAPAVLALLVLKPLRRAFIGRSMNARAQERIMAARAPLVSP